MLDLFYISSFQTDVAYEHNYYHQSNIQTFKKIHRITHVLQASIAIWWAYEINVSKYKQWYIYHSLVSYYWTSDSY